MSEYDDVITFFDEPYRVGSRDPLVGDCGKPRGVVIGEVSLSFGCEIHEANCAMRRLYPAPEMTLSTYLGPLKLLATS